MGYTHNTRNTRNLANHVIPTKRMGSPKPTFSIPLNHGTLEGISSTLPDGSGEIFFVSFFESQSMLEQTTFVVGTSLPVSGSTCNHNDDIPGEEDTDG